MSEIETLFRRVSSVPFVGSSEITVDIPRVQDINAIAVHVTGSLVIGTDAATALANESPAGMISSFDFVANGKDVLHQIPGKVACRGNYHRKFASMNTAPGLTVATHAVDVVYMLDRDNIGGPRPKDSAFQAYLTNLLQLRMVTDSETNALATPDTTTTLAFTGTINVYVDSVNELGDRGEKKFVKKVTKQSQAFTGANSAYQFTMPRGNHMRGVLFHCTDDGVPSDAIINSAEFSIDGVDTRFKADYAAMRHKNARDLKIPLADIPAGYAFMDLAPTGKMSNLADLTNASEAVVTLDVAAPSGTTGIVEAIVEEYIFPAG